MLAVAIVIALVLANALTPQEQGPIPLQDQGSAALQDQGSVNEQTSPVRTWAVGRQLVDLPSNWEYSTSSNVTLHFGLGSNPAQVTVRVLGEGVPQDLFASEVARRASLIQAAVNSRTGKSMLLESVSQEPRQTLLRYYSETNTDKAQTLELHRLVDEVYVMVRSEVNGGGVAPVEANVKRVADSIEMIETNETAEAPEPTGPGFALGPIILRGNYDHEVSTVNYYLPASNVKLGVSLSALTPDGQPRLISRFERPAAMQDKPLKQGERTVAGMSAEQVLVSFDNANASEGTRHHEFKFNVETYRDKPSLAQPALSLELSGGGHIEPVAADTPTDLVRWSLPSFAEQYWELPPQQRPPVPAPKDPPLTDQEAMVLWDAILDSLRSRPGAVLPP